MPTITIQVEITDEQHTNLVNNLVSKMDADSVKLPEAAVAPTPQATPQPDETPSADAMLDNRGVPWHPDHHAGTKTTNADGTWKRKRGGNKEAAEAYEKSYTQPAAQPVADVAEAPQITANPEDRQDPATPYEPQDIPPFLKREPETPAMPEPAAMPAMPAPAPAPVTYEMMMAALESAKERFGSDETLAAIPGIYEKAGVTNPGTLATDETQRASVTASLNALGQ